MKLCECGCGKPTPLAKRTDARTGAIAGQPLRFFTQVHARRRRDWRGTSNGYVVLYRPEHPNANKSGLVKEHVLMVETVLGKPLPPKADVHHVNGDRADNRNDNFVACEDRAYHFLLQRRSKALAACGHPDWRCCIFCHRYGPESLMTVRARGAYHAECNRADARKRYYQARGLPVPGLVEVPA